MSYKQLQQSNYVQGTDFIRNPEKILCREDTLVITVPNPKFPPKCQDSEEAATAALVGGTGLVPTPDQGASTCQGPAVASTDPGGASSGLGDNNNWLIPLNRYSNIDKLVKIYSVYVRLANILKQRLRARDPAKFQNLVVYDRN